MSTLKLSDVEVGNVKPPCQWSNDAQKFVDLNPFDCFIKDLGKSEAGLVYVDGNISEGAAYHRNYMRYLEKCWAEHLGIIVTPDILWYTLLCELASVVKSDPDKYRSLFSRSQDKQDIVIMTGEPVVMPLSILVEKLKQYVPTDSDLFMPDFTTSSMRSRHAFRAAFCDMCSPYYRYMMLMCGFPAIDVRGTVEDYTQICDNWDKISQLFNSHGAWFARVKEIMSNCVKNLENPDWWIKMFSLERCGSGGQVLTSGWFSQLFLETPEIAYPENFPSCVSVVDYKQLDYNKNYRMMDGLFMSRMEGDFLVPNFGFVVFERTGNHV